MASFGSLVLLKLHVQDCTGNRRAISGLVREGITLLEGIMNVVKQHGGNCNVEFNAQMAKHYLKEVEIGGLRLRDWIQFYSIRGAGVESETAEMCFRVLRSSDVFWENLTSQVLSGSQEFSFLLRDDVGMTADIPNPVNLLDADSVRRLNAVSFDGISPSLHVTSSVPGAIFFTPNDARNLQQDANIRNQDVYTRVSMQPKSIGGGGSSHGDSMDAKLIQQKESEQFYVTGTFNPTTDTASLDKTNLLTKSGIDFSGSGEFALQQLILQNLAVQSTTLPIQHQEPVVSSSIQSGGSQNTYQVQSAPGAAPSSFRSDFLPFVSASSETVNTSRTQFLSENQQIQPQSASQNPILVASRESTASVGQSYSLPATEIRQPGPNTLLSSAIAPQFVLTPVQRPLLNQFLVRATVSAISQQALRASDILYSEPRIPQPVLSQPVLPKQVILPSKFPRNSEKSSSSLFFVSSMLTIPHQMPRLEPQHDVVAEQNQIRVISSILSVPAIEFPSTRSVVSVQSPAVSLSFSAPNQQEPQKPEPPKSEKPIEVKAVSFLSQISQPSQFSTEVKYAGVVFVPHVRPAPHTKVVRYMESIPVPQISAIIRTPRQKLQTESSRVSRQERKPASRKLPEAKSSGKKPRIAKKEPSPKFRRGLEDKFPRKKFRKFEPLNDAPINAKPKTLKNVVRRAEKHKTETPKSEKKKPERKMPGTPAQKSDSQKARTSENGKPEKMKPVKRKTKSQIVMPAQRRRSKPSQNPASEFAKVRPMLSSRFRSVKEKRKSEKTMQISNPEKVEKQIQKRNTKKAAFRREKPQRVEPRWSKETPKSDSLRAEKPTKPKFRVTNNQRRNPKRAEISSRAEKQKTRKRKNSISFSTRKQGHSKPNSLSPFAVMLVSPRRKNHLNS